MGLQALAGRWLDRFARLPMAEALLHHPSVRRHLDTTRLGHHLYPHAWQRRHPFDRAWGTDTSGLIPIDQLTASPELQAHGVFYAGSQPSVIRSALLSLPDLSAFTFVDIGCGKGRAVLVACEFPFRRVIGVDLSDDLLAIARHNMAVAGRHDRRRQRAEFVHGDALTVAFPPGPLVVYLYHPFDAPLMARLVTRLEEALIGEPGRALFVIYCNPVAGHCFDTSPHFRRRRAVSIPYSEEDRGFGPDVADPVITWQAGHGLPPQPDAAVEAAESMDIVVTPPRRRAVLRPRRQAGSQAPAGDVGLPVD